MSLRKFVPVTKKRTAVRLVGPNQCRKQMTDQRGSVLDFSISHVAREPVNFYCTYVATTRDPRDLKSPSDMVGLPGV